MMKQREWMGYAAAVLAAGAFLTGCGNIRKLAKSDPEVGAVSYTHLTLPTKLEV